MIGELRPNNFPKPYPSPHAVIPHATGNRGSNRGDRGGYHETEDGCDRQCRKSLPHGGRRCRWRNPSCCRSGTLKRMQGSRGVQDGRGEDHLGIQAACPLRDSHGWSGLEGWQCRRGRTPGVLLPELARPRGTGQPPHYCVSRDQYRCVWVPVREGCPHRDHHRSQIHNLSPSH
ncbi:MAG: hypothetical protein A4E42_01234 [Methanoregulaceae archaeon PtaU1.Bin222]|nr:MAG: hypothetical protein A4E42_01234 [Methanoregulaceae archaeon PtaU1.Bin222]